MTHGETAWSRWRAWLVAGLVVILFLIVLRVLEGEISHLRYYDIVQAFRHVPLSKTVAALVCTVAAYLVLPGYDLLALVYTRHRLPLRRIAYGSLVTYGISQTLGFPALTGSTLRMRLWSAWGLGTTEIARAVAFAGVTFSLGVVFLAGLVGLGESEASLARIHIPLLLARVLAALCLTSVLLYVAWSLFTRGRTFRLWRIEVPVPPPRLIAGQFAVAVVDWSLAALVLYVLLPDGHGVHFPAFVALFILAQTAGLISHVPGGLGVFETLMLLQLSGVVATDRLLGALLAYRVIFYLIPFGTAITLLAAHEGRVQRERLSRGVASVAEGFARWAEPLLPAGIGVMTMVGGIILLVSGATPAVHGRMAALIEVLPLGVVELSHFAGSMVGAALLVLGWGLTRRLDAAYFSARILLAIGIVASLLKGLDYEEALTLAVVLALLTASRGAFYRKSSLLAEPLTPGWVAAIVTVVAVSIWVGLFTFKHVEYSHELWWRFAARADAPRFLRASAGAAALLSAGGALRLLRHAAPRLSLPTREELAQVSPILAKSEDTMGALALLGDKYLMLSDDGNGLLMYGVSGRSWVALGDPLGPDSARRELAWRFRETADEHGGWAVFYEVSARYLATYVDLGLTLLKVGEEAFVPLASFSLEGPTRRGLRRTQRDMQKAGTRFEVVPAERVREILPTLKAISDDWLAAKATREKGFSLGRFDPDYLVHFPHALIRVGDRVVAFANLWTGSGHELAPDLMRYVRDAPHGVMEYLFTELMLWGRANGFARLSLGMAPLSGLETRALAPRWHRFASLLYRHGEHFYNFQGLRQYKEKFDPVWEPRYLATPAGLALPRVLTNVASLISGGITGLFAK